MNSLDLFDMESRRVQRQHEDAQMAFRALLGDVLDLPTAWMPATRRSLQILLHDARVHWSRAITPDEGGQLREAVNEVMTQAEADTGLELPDAARANLFSMVDQSAETAALQIRDALRLDEDTAMGVLRSLQMKAAMKSAAGIDPRIAFNMVKGGSLSGIAFTRRDRAGRAWDTTVYTRTVVRALLVNTYVETFVMTLLANGIDEAKVHVEGDHYIKFGLLEKNPQNDFIDLGEAAQAYFHPNATRLPERV